MVLTAGLASGVAANTTSDLTTTPASGRGVVGVVIVIATGNARIDTPPARPSTKKSKNSLADFRGPYTLRLETGVAPVTGTLVLAINST